VLGHLGAGGQGFVDGVLAPGNAPDDFHELLAGDFLAKVGDRLGLEGQEQLGIVGVGGEHDDADIGRALLYLAGEVQAALRGPIEVQQGDIGLGLGDFLEGDLAGRRAANDLDFLEVGEGADLALQKTRLVLDEVQPQRLGQLADFCFERWLGRCFGTSLAGELCRC